MEFNPYLAGAANAGEANKGGLDSIEHPTTASNIPWQTRPALLTVFEDALATTLQDIFRDGIEDLPTLVSRLNASTVKHPEGNWTEANYQSLMAQLAKGGLA